MKNSQNIKDKVSPLTLVIDKDTWNLFKVYARAKDKSLNNFICELIAKEIKGKEDSIKAFKEI